MKKREKGKRENRKIKGPEMRALGFAHEEQIEDYCEVVFFFLLAANAPPARAIARAANAKRFIEYSLFE